MECSMVPSDDSTQTRDMTPIVLHYVVLFKVFFPVVVVPVLPER